MIIILEGVDKAGKTTLAKEIQKHLHWPIVHFGKPGPRPADEYIAFLKELKGDVICDRFFVGQFVYGPLLRGHVNMSSFEINTIEKLCKTISTLFIHVNPPYSIIEARLKKIGDSLISNKLNKLAYIKFNTVIPDVEFQYKIIWDGTSVTGFAKWIAWGAHIHDVNFNGR